MLEYIKFTFSEYKKLSFENLESDNGKIFAFRKLLS